MLEVITQSRDRKHRENIDNSTSISITISTRITEDRMRIARQPTQPPR